MFLNAALTLDQIDKIADVLIGAMERAVDGADRG
jgi:hypothetical protein